MKDRKQRLEDIEREASDQLVRTDELSAQIEQHRARVDRLQELIDNLRAQSAALASEDLERALAGAERAGQETDSRLAEARAQREAEQENNRELTQQAGIAYEGRLRAAEKIAQFDLVGSSEIADGMRFASDEIEKECARFARLHDSLLEARERLEHLDV